MKIFFAAVVLLIALCCDVFSQNISNPPKIDQWVISLRDDENVRAVIPKPNWDGYVKEVKYNLHEGERFRVVGYARLDSAFEKTDVMDYHIVARPLNNALLVVNESGNRLIRAAIRDFAIFPVNASDSKKGAEEQITLSLMPVVTSLNLPKIDHWVISVRDDKKVRAVIPKPNWDGYIKEVSCSLHEGERFKVIGYAKLDDAFDKTDVMDYHIIIKPLSNALLVVNESGNRLIRAAMRDFAILPDKGGDDTAQGNVASYEKQFGWYYIMLHDRFYARWDQPRVEGQNGQEYKTFLSIKISRIGRVLGVSLAKTSGNKIVDDSVLFAAQRISQVDPLPRGLGDANGCEVRMEFKLSP